MGFCIGCKERWESPAVAHCTDCHKTFRSVGGFDKHRRNFKCLIPEDIGMKMDEKGRWFTPMPEKYVSKLRHRHKVA